MPSWEALGIFRLSPSKPELYFCGVSIVSRSGDKGTTALTYKRRVSKTHPRIEAYGAVDELNAAIGLARATAEEAPIRDHLLAIQKELITLMGELAITPEDMPRFIQDGYTPVASEMTARLEKLVNEFEVQSPASQGWATPGVNLAAAALEVARTVCRRAERRVCALHEAGQLPNGEVIVYLNRLSDLLWLFARQAENKL
jgi:cob(I)alamin adenosyltransferase